MRNLAASLLVMSCTPALRTVRGESLRTELAAPQPGQLHQVQGLALWVHDSDPSGSRPALLCLHAIGHGGGDFAALSSALPDWRVISIDWPGHGRSEADTQPASATRYAALLEALVSEMHLERPVIVGNSIGGAAAIRYAALHPENVRALVLANPGGLDRGASQFFGRFFIRTLVSRFEHGARNEVRFANWFADYYADVLPAEAARSRRQQIVSAGYESAPILVDAWTSFTRPEEFIAPLLPKLRMPTLVTWADRDRLVSWSRNRDAISTLPNARIVHFTNSGHAAFLEEPELFLAEVRLFLRSL